jgi:hypothetical protein
MKSEDIYLLTVQVQISLCYLSQCLVEHVNCYTSSSLTIAQCHASSNSLTIAQCHASSNSLTITQCHASSNSLAVTRCCVNLRIDSDCYLVISAIFNNLQDYLGNEMFNSNVTVKCIFCAINSTLCDQFNCDCNLHHSF